MRLYTLGKHGLVPKSLISGLDALPNFSKWAAEVIKQESVLYVFSEEKAIAAAKKRIAAAAESK